MAVTDRNVLVTLYSVQTVLVTDHMRLQATILCFRPLDSQLLHVAADRRTDWSKGSYLRHARANENMVRERVRKQVVHSVMNNIVEGS